MGSTKRKNRKNVLKSIKRLQENLKVLQSLKK
jgi:hypothetical protein